MNFRQLMNRIMGFFPSALPTGMTAMDEFIESITATYGLPSNPSYHRMIAMMIQHLPAEKVRAPKHYFYKAILRAQANETAYYKLQALKEAEDMAKNQEATPTVEPPLGQENPPEPTA